MTSPSRWAILGFALLGLAFAASSSWVHYRLLTDPSYISPCDINATFSCTQAYLSRYGSVLGVPVAIGGVAWFALVALIAAFATPDLPGAKTSGAAGSYVFGLATIGLAAVLYLGYASFFELKTYCLLCIGTYVSVVAIFVTSGLTTSVGMGSVPSRIVGDLRTVLRKPAMLTVALLYIVAAASGVALFPREMKASAAPPAAATADEETQFRQAWAAQPRIDLGIAAGTAKVVVVKFNDWLCPSCKAYALLYEPVLDQYEKSDPGAVKVVIKDWPWNSTCNFKASTIPGHEAACDAAVAVRLARAAGQEHAMIDWLFENQSRLIDQGRAGAVSQATEAIRRKAAELGVKDFAGEYAVAMMQIRRDIADGAALGVRSTPTFFINGVRIPDGSILPAKFFDLAVAIELKKGGQ